MNPHDLLSQQPIDDNFGELVVPDSVTPYLGWKALQLQKDGTLTSPTYDAQWPALQPLQANCRIQFESHSIWQWAPSRQPLDRDPPTPFGIPTTTPVYLTPAGDFDSQPPRIELPDGYHWNLEHQITPIVSEHCSCGIYAVDEPEACSYFQQLHKNMVLVQIALWGRVIPASEGARGEYAYPQQIIAPPQLAARAELARALYQVPVLIDDRAEATPEQQKSSRSKYLTLGMPHLYLALFLSLLVVIWGSASTMPPLGILAMLLLSVPPIVMITLVLRDWDLFT